MESIHELLGYKNIKIVQNSEMFCFSLDSILLADFVNPKIGCKKIIDLGCGNAPIPLFLSLKTDAEITGVEIQKEVFELAVKSVRLNGLEAQIKIINSDIKDIYLKTGANVFDIVISNPPYFKVHPESNINKNKYLTIARHEVMINLEGVVLEAKKLLKNGGSFYLVHRTERLTETVNLLTENNFGIRRMRFVYPKRENNALLFLLEAGANLKDDVKVESPLYVYEEGEYSQEVKEIFNFKKNEYH
ncbi:MAG TPA: tRNA1(Val) (adenine(37)-N6)-methyltransferase [Acholeplasmataceae bacterium]|jgi:tRNA1Val (adenine37-N6)-methyltransferase|nr:tRNA1(Val) (adenine(37)-N6)-methyltransferase [Acholeplasmataceae bacterium]